MRVAGDWSAQKAGMCFLWCLEPTVPRYVKLKSWLFLQFSLRQKFRQDNLCPEGWQGGSSMSAVILLCGQCRQSPAFCIASRTLKPWINRSHEATELMEERELVAGFWIGPISRKDHLHQTFHLRAGGYWSVMSLISHFCPLTQFLSPSSAVDSCQVISGYVKIQ